MDKIRLYVAMIVGVLCCASCSESAEISEPVPQYMTVILSLDLPSDESNASRMFVDGQPLYDETTALQKAIGEGDVYVLAFQHNRLIAHARGNKASASGNPADIQFQFLRPQTSTQMEFAVMTNLNAVMAESVTTVLDRCAGLESAQVYRQMAYSFPGEWDISQKRIPMWGMTSTVTVQPDNGKVFLSCLLHRAIAKLGFRVNVNPITHEAQGYATEQMKLLEIRVKGAMNQSYAAPLRHDSSCMDHSGQYPFFTQIFVPETAVPLPIEAVYTNRRPETYTCEFLDMIYLPEQDTQTYPLTLSVRYSLRGVEQPVKHIVFDSSEQVIRNHSYIYNIRMTEESDLQLDYQVMPWNERPQVDLPFN